MDEITNSPTDRRAMDILLQRFPDTRGIDPNIATVGLLNETWARMAAALAQADDGGFAEVTAGVAADRDQLAALRDQTADQFPGAAFPAEDAGLAAYDRVLALLNLVTDWRWQTYAATEVAAGRDPYQPAPPA